MAMTGKFGADFAEFYDEAAKANSELAAMQAWAGKVDQGVATMATTMGGASTTISTGVAKMGTTTTTTGNSFSTMATQLQTADKSLNAFGVSVSPAINVLNEMGQASGKTMTQMGALGTATTALAVGLASFKATQFILEITGADKALDEFYKNLFAFKTAGAEAGAAQDVITRALERGAPAAISFNEALEFNARWLKEHRDATNNSANAVAAWEVELANVRKRGDYGALMAELKAGNLTHKELEERFTLTARALDFLTRKTADQKKAWEEAHEPAKKAAAAAEQHAAAIQRLSEQMLGGGAIKAAQDYITALGPMANLSKMTADETAKLHAALGSAMTAYTALGVTAPQALRDIYVATIPLPGVTEGLGLAWDSVGTKVHVKLETILADLAKVQSQEEKNQEFYKQLDAEIAAAYKSATDGANAATAATQQTTGAVNQTANAYANLASSAQQYKQMAASLEFDAAFNTRQGGTAAILAMNQRDAAAKARAQAGILEARDTYLASQTSSAPWGRQGSVSTVTNVGLTVNAAGNGDDISKAVLDGMRRQGVRLGS